MSDPNAGTVDTWGMAWIHQVYRREFGLMPALARGVAAGDRDRSATVAGHIIDLSLSLQDHHQNEDELLWPPLLARLAPDLSVIHRMEDEHEQLHKLLLQTLDLAASWRDDPTAEKRDLLADVLDRMSATSADHMGDEEAHLMPLLRKHIAVAEWQEFEARGAASVPPDKALMFIGMGLEDATAYEREKVMGLMPPELQQMWEESGVHEYQRMRAELLGQS
jgi:iron-sulfur cluster repair protein YtfE (RIC family)